MKIEINSHEQVGAIVRATRKAMQMRQDDTAGTIGVSENFLGKVERGGDTVQWGKLFLVLQELGLSLSIEVPDTFQDEINQALESDIKKRNARAHGHHQEQ